MKLQLCGPLRVAGQLVGDDGNIYNHIITVIGVDEETKRVRIVNPRKKNLYDNPVKAWIWWSEFKPIIESTLCAGQRSIFNADSSDVFSRRAVKFSELFNDEKVCLQQAFSLPIFLASRFNRRKV